MSKFSTDGNYNFTTLDKLSGVITDTKPKTDIFRAAEEFGINIIYA